MVKVLYGKKGMGKTRILVDNANNLAVNGIGNVVFIDGSNQLIYDLKHEVRFINVSEFPIEGTSAFLGFICGVIAENYDINGIFIDGLTYILKTDIGALKDFFVNLKKIAHKFNIKFLISINGDPDMMPEYIKEYIA